MFRNRSLGGPDIQSRLPFPSCQIRPSTFSDRLCPVRPTCIQVTWRFCFQNIRNRRANGCSTPRKHHDFHRNHSKCILGTTFPEPISEFMANGDALFRPIELIIIMPVTFLSGDAESHKYWRSMLRDPLDSMCTVIGKRVHNSLRKHTCADFEHIYKSGEWKRRTRVERKFLNNFPSFRIILNRKSYPLLGSHAPRR